MDRGSNCLSLFPTRLWVLALLVVTSESDQLSQALSALCWCHSWGPTSRPACCRCHLPSSQLCGTPPFPLGSPHPQPVGICEHCLSVSRPGRGLCGQDWAYTCPFFLEGGADRSRGVGQIWENRCFWKRRQGNSRGKAGRRQHQNLEDPRPLGWNQFGGTGPSSPRGLGTAPSQGQASTGAHPGGHDDRFSEVAHPPPGCTSASPPPAPAMQRFTLCIYCCSPLRPPPLCMGRVCRLAVWQEPAVSLWVPASPLISAWTPCARVRPRRDLAPAKAALSLHPTAKGPAAPGLSPLPYRGLHPTKGGGQSQTGQGRGVPLGEAKAMGGVTLRQK